MDRLKELLSDVLRKEVREVQNKLVKILLKNGYEKTDKIPYRDAFNKDLTIRDLERVIYPQFIDNFKDIINSWK